MATTKITILQRGGKKNHRVLDRAARFFLRERLSARMANRLSLRIEVRATKLAAGTMAKVLLPTNGSAASRDFTIVLDRDRSLVDQVADLAHEVVHIEQAASGRYQVRRWKSDRKVHARWEGVDLGPLDQIDYAARPWEVEARREGGPMSARFWRTELDRIIIDAGNTGE